MIDITESSSRGELGRTSSLRCEDGDEESFRMDLTVGRISLLRCEGGESLRMDLTSDIFIGSDTCGIEGFAEPLTR